MQLLQQQNYQFTGNSRNSLIIFATILGFLYIILRKTMGCGVACGAIILKSTKHSNHSKSALNQLLEQLYINPPLLSETSLRRFTTSLSKNQQAYILPVSNGVNNDDQFPETIKQKWKIVIFGLFKNDQFYKNCLGFSLRVQEQQLSVCNKVDRNSGFLNNSYHQVKEATQYHTCFQQIQKDLNRTFEFKQETRALFQRVLKKISNHFPGMGYTQGVNFVVGFLLVLGYTQADTFWMFVHLALNKKYLLLGLYEDDFPLAAVYTLLFKNLLKRYDKQLYSHLYEELLLQDSVWIFKWFITYFIYSFPLQTIKFVWDLTIQLGAVGLVFYAVSLVLNLKSELLKIDDACDFSEFLQGLKQLQNFNKYLKINEVVQSAYQIKLTKQDFEGLNNLKDSFYKHYFKSFCTSMDQQVNNKTIDFKDVTAQSTFAKIEETNQKLHLWYQKLAEERLQFLMKSEDQKNRKMIVPQILKEDYEDLQKSIKLLQQIVVQNQSLKFAKRVNSQILENASQQLTNQEISNKKNPLEPQDGRVGNYKKPPYDISEEIGQREGQSDSNEQIYISQHYGESRNDSFPSQQFSINVQHHEQRQQFKNQQGQSGKITMLIAEIQNIREKVVRDNVTKTNNIKIVMPEVKSSFGLAGQNIINNSCINSQFSNQSKNAAVKPRKNKENNISRYQVNKISKLRTYMIDQAGKLSNSSEQESLDQKTDSFTGHSHGQCRRQKFGGNELDYAQRKTQQQLMVTSHLAQPIKVSGFSKDVKSEIQIYNGEGFFKKKKRITSRNNALNNINQELSVPIRSQIVTNINLHVRNQRIYNQQQSLESIIELSTFRQNRNRVNHLEELLCEIESIK